MKKTIFLIIFTLIFLSCCTRNEITSDKNNTEANVIEDEIDETIFIPPEIAEYEPRFSVKIDGEWKTIDINGNLLGYFDTYDLVYDFSEGLAAFEDDDKYGYLDCLGNIIIENEFIYGKSFSDGLAAVSIEKDGKELYGYINKQSELRIDYQFDYPGDFHDGFANVKINEKEDYIDKNGDFPFDIDFKYGEDFSEGYAVLKIQDVKFLMDIEGNLITLPQYTKSISAINDGFSRIEIHGREGYINAKGEIVIPPQYLWAGTFIDGIVPVKESHEVRHDAYYIDKQGNQVFNKKFITASSFSEGLAEVVEREENGEPIYAFIDKNGEVQFELPPWVTGTRPFHEGLAVIYKDRDADRKTGYVNKEGEIVWQPTK